MACTIARKFGPELLVLSSGDRHVFSLACTIGRQFGQVEESPVNANGVVDPETEPMRIEIYPILISGSRCDGSRE